MEDTRTNYLLCAALEFGTTYSGYAFSTKSQFKEEPLYILCNQHWKAGDRNILSMKTPTCLLLDKEKQFVAFGYDAENRYAELVMDEKQDDYYFFDRFTMSLHNNENVTRDMVLQEKTGKQCSAVEVFTLSIKAFVDDLMKHLAGVSFRQHEVLWVLTVSATWTDSAKQLMRESAEKAGLQPKMLLLVTEPEAAFTYCYYISTTELQGCSHAIMMMDPGTKSLVVDLGDATADITVLQTTYNGQLKELCRATGDNCGRTSIVDRFYKMLEEIVGGNVITEMKKQSPSDWLEMLREFRIQLERHITFNSKATVFDIPLSLMDVCQKLHGNDLKFVIESSSYVNEMTLSGNMLRCKEDLMIKLLTPTFDSIINLMKNTLTNRSTNGLSNILMVGGLSECRMMQDEVRTAFPGMRFIVPTCYNGVLSVLMGAVLFGHRPDYNRSELCEEEGIGK